MGSCIGTPTHSAWWAGGEDGHRARRGEGTGKFHDHLPRLPLSHNLLSSCEGGWPSGGPSLWRWAGRNFPCSGTKSGFTTRAVSHGLSVSPIPSTHLLTRSSAQHSAKPLPPLGLPICRALRKESLTRERPLSATTGCK